MRSLAEDINRDDPLVDMMNERTGLWKITADRVALLSTHRALVSEHNRKALDEMLLAANRGERLWNCTGEYFALLGEIQKISATPDESEIHRILQMVIESSKKDKVDHREWVKETIRLLTNMTRRY